MGRITDAFLRMTARRAVRSLSERQLHLIADEVAASARNETVAHKNSFRLLNRLAGGLNVDGLRIAGKYGAMQSTIGDLVIMEEYSRNGTFADRTNRLLADFFGEEGGLYIDIGANIGMTLIPVAKNPRVQCVAFEPEPKNFANLKANVAANCAHNNIELHNLALYSKAGHMAFELDPENLGDHRIRVMSEDGQQQEAARKVIQIEARPLDDWLNIVKPRMAVKIDTQGAEPFVFEGGREFLSRADLIILEFWPYGMNRMGGDIDEIFKVLRPSFPKIAWAGFEEGIVSEDHAPPEGLWLLGQSNNASKNDPYMYWDVIARK